MGASGSLGAALLLDFKRVETATGQQAPGRSSVCQGPPACSMLLCACGVQRYAHPHVWSLSRG